MVWKYKYPLLEEYDTVEDYKKACESYEWAEDQYIDEYRELYYEKKYKIDN